MDYEVWLGLVDEACYEICGMAYDDLPDLVDAYEYWEAGETPKQFAKALFDEASGGGW